ncbi:hypothetical protein ACHAW6_004235 [Cyclotella cf. meneghiniana]
MKLSTLVVFLCGPYSTSALLSKEKSNRSNRSSNNSGGTFNDGVARGQSHAERIWRQQGSSCDNIWGFEDSVNRHIRRNYVDTGDWRTDSFNRGVRAGADQVVQQKQEKCLNDSPDECYDLGIAAAQEIAFNFCPFTSQTATFGNQNWKRQCREVATGVCEGAILNQVRANGCSMTTSQLRTEQNRCRGQVNRMTNNNEGLDVVEVTRNLRKK